MLAKIIFFTALIAATLAVILLALASPSPHNKSHRDRSVVLGPWLALSLYIQPPRLPPPPPPPPHQQAADHPIRAYIFHHNLTEGPENTSRVIGRAHGFIVPLEHVGLSAFNIMYLTFDTPHCSGGLGVEARQQVGRGSGEELTVVGGTGYFAFARGIAVFVQKDRQPSDADATHHLKLRLRFPG